MMKHFLFIILLFSRFVSTAQAPDPVPPAEPSINQFVNLATTSNNINASQFGANPITDGTGATDAGAFIIDQKKVLIGTHLYSGQGNPFTHPSPSPFPTFRDTVTLQGFISGNVFTTPSPLFIFGTGTINFQYLTIDQSLGGTPEPIFLKNCDILIPLLAPNENCYLNFINGKIYAVNQEKIIFASRTYALGGSSLSYFDGTMFKSGPAFEFVFVLGDQNIYAPLTITGSNANPYSQPMSGTSARYYAVDPGNTNIVSGDLLSVSNKEYYDFRTSGDLSKLTMETNHFSYGASDPSRLTIAGWNGTSWVNLQPGHGPGTAGTNTISISANFYQVPLPQYSKITLGIVSSVTPIIWESFTAFSKDNKGQLSWTAQLTNVQSFSIESSSDGKTFYKIGSLNASMSKTYNFIDAVPCSDIVYYRIFSNDFDGKKMYSDIKVVNFKKQISLKVWPNPVKDWLNVSIPISEAEHKIKFEIFNSIGKRLTDKIISLSSGEVYRVNINSFPAGIYQLRISYNNTQYFKKIIRS